MRKLLKNTETGFRIATTVQYVMALVQRWQCHILWSAEWDTLAPEYRRHKNGES